MKSITPVASALAVFAVLGLVSKKTHFDCPHCGHASRLAGWRFAVAPNLGLKKYASCPNCHYRARMAIAIDKN